MPNGRCKLHGGKSTGPRTPEGLERSRRANWKHGYYSREAKAERSRVRAAILAVRNGCGRHGNEGPGGTGKPCQGAAMPNGRCKLHGGKSTGPRTPEGLEAELAMGANCSD